MCASGSSRSGFRQVRQGPTCIGVHRHLTIRSSRPRVVASAVCFTLRLHTSAAPPQGGLTQALGRMQVKSMEFVEIEGGANPEQPLIYLWEIVAADGEALYRYVGKAAGGANRPRKHYRRNVNNLLHGRPYRKNKPTEFRSVHHRLAEALQQGHALRLSFICNIVPGQNINAVERHWQEHYGVV